MGIDASIYGQIQAPPPVSPLDNAQKVMSLASLAYQSQQQQIQMQTRTAMMQAYAANTDPQTGQVNEPGVVSFVARVNPMAAQELSGQIAARQKAQAEAVQARQKASEDAYNLTGPAFEHLFKDVPEDQRAAVWPNMIADLKAKGVDVSRMDHPYDPQLAQTYYQTYLRSKPALENIVKGLNAQKTQGDIAMQPLEAQAKRAAIAKTYSEIGDIGDKRLQSLKDDLDPNKARGGNMAKNQSVVDSADRLNAMFKQFPDHNIPKAQQTEMISAFGSMLNGGSAPFVSQLEELVPKSARGNANAMMSWAFNEPMGAQQQKFMELLHDSVNRERDVADQKVKADQVQRLAAHKLVRQSDPEGYASVLHGYGIEPENVQNGKYAPTDQQTAPLAGRYPSAPSTPQAPAGSTGKQGGPPSLGIPSANAAGKAQPSASDTAALSWLKSADPSSPEAFQVRAKLKKRGLL